METYMNFSGTRIPPIIKTIYYPIAVLTKIAWIIISIIIMFKYDETKNFFLLFIVVNSVLCLYRYIYELRELDNENVNSCYYASYRMCVIMNILFYYLFTVIFIYMKCTEMEICAFLWMYITLEYIVLTIIIIILYLSVRYGSQSCCPIMLAHMAEDYLPISPGLSSEKLGGLEKQKYSVSDETSECPICLNVYHVNDDILVLYCEHTFHYTCAMKWFLINKSCPICRMEI